MAAPAPRPASAPRAHARTAGATRGTVGPFSGPRWPDPIATKTFLKVRLRYAKGSLSQLELRKITYPKVPNRTRIVGRFLAKAYHGQRLVDVVPFNFPLLAPAETYTSTGARIASRMEANLVTATELEVPWLPSLDRVLIEDVATGRAWPLDLSPMRPQGSGAGQTPRDPPRPAPRQAPKQAPRQAPKQTPRQAPR